MDDLGVPLFLETPIYHILLYYLVGSEANLDFVEQVEARFSNYIIKPEEKGKNPVNQWECPAFRSS